MVEQLHLHEIILKRAFQARLNGVDPQMVQDYVEALDSGATFPPIDVYRTPDGRLLLVDGWHRYYAHKTCCLTTIKANVYEGNEETAQDYALYRANRTNGQRLSKKDVREITRIAVADPRFADLSDRKLGTVIGVSYGTVHKIRKEMGVIRHTSHSNPNVTNDEVARHNERNLKERRASYLMKDINKAMAELKTLTEFADPHLLAQLSRDVLSHLQDINSAE